MARTAWVVRNYKGEVLLHNRQAFSGITSFVEAKSIGLVCAAESIGSHHLNKVIFETEAKELVGAVEEQMPGHLFVLMGLRFVEL